MTPPSDSAATDSDQSQKRSSGWSSYWNVSKSLVRSFHPDFDPSQGPGQPDTPWIQLNIQPKELALRLVQKTIPANSYLNTINQVAMACLALASLPGCHGYTTKSSNPADTVSPTTPSNCSVEPIPVDSSATLGKIGKPSEPCYSADKRYLQSGPIDAGKHQPIERFTGDYNGGGNAISNLKGCMFNRLEGDGAVRNLTVTDGQIDRTELDDADSEAFVACTMAGSSKQENIVVENSTIRITAEKPEERRNLQLGMLAGKMNESTTLKGNLVNIATMAIQGSAIDAGMLAGQALDNATIDSNQVKNSRVCLSGIGSGKRIWNKPGPDPEINVNIGLIAGKTVGYEHDNVVVRNSTLLHNHIKSSEFTIGANLGGVVGRAKYTHVEGTLAHGQNRIHSHSLVEGRIAMVVADARQCTIVDTTSRDNHLLATANSITPTLVGIVTAECHNSTIEHTLDVDSDLDLFHSSIKGADKGGHVAVAAAVANGCNIHNTTAIETIIDAEVNNSSVAIAVAFNDGDTAVHQTTAVDCVLFAWEKNTDSYTGSAAVGVAAGRYDNVGRVSNTTACNVEIKGYSVGIAAAGDPYRSFTGTSACNTELTSFADNISSPVEGCDDDRCLAAERAGDELTPMANRGLPMATCDLMSPVIKQMSSAMPTRQTGSPVSVAPGNGTINSTASALRHNNSEEVSVDFPAALTGGIVAGGVVGIAALYALYQWYQGYQQGLGGKALAIYPFTWIKDAIGKRLSTENSSSTEELSALQSTSEV
ncbi:hypothetical protein [Endozoicomonas sp. SESOKO1]|uniref:hypothetical protein n=1 Tax=Endozoicomonas sp. SESOKO1 TaxID=2828742 RepID=UPI0021484E9B|nr:hypothetical protein [Endozoicomonas sp. SESOKO1]